MSTSSRAANLLRSGLIFSAVNFLTGMGNFAFQAVIGRHLQQTGQFGSANSAISGFLPLLGLLPTAATFAVTHYIAHFSTIGDHDRLQGLFLGCRKFLFWLTIGGSVLILIVIKPLSDFFAFDEAVMLASLICALLGLWGAFATALCQGLGWFKRLALIGFLSMSLRFLFGWVVVVLMNHPKEELAVLASAFSLLANLTLLIWRKDLAVHGTPVSPVNREFIHYLVVSTAFVVGSYCFLQGDNLVAKKFLLKSENDAFACAKMLAVALPTTVGPMLTVLFTARSRSRTGGGQDQQVKLMGVYVVGLLAGAAMLYALRGFCIRLILGHTSVALSATEGMICPLSLTMVIVGLLIALAQWSLASRWSRVTLLYGALGVVYWLGLLAWGWRGGSGQTAAGLLHVMPFAAGFALLLLVGAWYVRMHRRRGDPA